MNSKMKGLLKGLRYISHIFEPSSDEDEGESEMQIGYPTDVKHVAHIGWDGPSVNSPSWMNEFRSAPLSSLGAEAMGELDPARFPSHDPNHNARIVQGSPIRDTRRAIVGSPRQNDQHRELPIPKPSRRHSSSGASAGPENPSKPGSPSSVPRQSRRNKSSEAAAASVDGTSQDNSEGSARHARRQNRAKEPGGGGAESTAQDLPPSMPKQARKKKKPKGPIGDGPVGSSTTRSSRSKGAATRYSDPALSPRRPEVGPAIKPIGE